MAEIAAAFAPDGFVYRPSARKLVRQAGEFRFEVYFQASRSNWPGLSVELWIHGLVFSKALKTWEANSPWPFQVTGCVGGGQIGNLDPTPDWLVWQFVDPSTRAAVTQAAIMRIRSSALPFFEVCTDRDRLLACLEVDERPLAVGLGSRPLGLALWLGDRDLARRLGCRQLERGDALAAYREGVRTYRANGIPRQEYELVNELAAITVAFDLSFDD